MGIGNRLLSLFVTHIYIQVYELLMNLNHHFQVIVSFWWFYYPFKSI